MITSLSNDKIKFIRKLKDKKMRENSGLFFAEGVRVVGEALEEGWHFEQFIFSRELFRDQYSFDLLKIAEEKNIPLLEVDGKVFKSLSTKEGPKGIGAVLQQQWMDLNLMLQTPGTYIGLDRIQDTGNLGTIMRTADATGVKGIILVGDCTDPYQVSTVKASMGALFSLKLARCDFDQFVNTIRKNKIFVAGTSDRGAVHYQMVQYPKTMVLLMGSEREGLPEPLFDLCDQLVYIPMVGKSDSLNLAVATGVCLYEILNQKQKGEGI